MNLAQSDVALWKVDIQFYSQLRQFESIATIFRRSPSWTWGHHRDCTISSTYAAKLLTSLTVGLSALVGDRK
ncbi:hypothetical protein QUA03_28345 [Microcoleus sp. S36b_A4]|uniref:hypothetical protein n=1 Tax=Microcoleus sp. S36b_A4 TaxID=3055420 RepID=UPI002FD12A10